MPVVYILYELKIIYIYIYIYIYILYTYVVIKNSKRAKTREILRAKAKISDKTYIDTILSLFLIYRCSLTVI